MQPFRLGHVQLKASAKITAIPTIALSTAKGYALSVANGLVSIARVDDDGTPLDDPPFLVPVEAVAWMRPEPEPEPTAEGGNDADLQP
jgi:hypothetical protein